MLSNLFGQLVRTTVNVATLPISLAKDVVTLAGAIDNGGTPHTVDKLNQIKDEASADFSKDKGNG